MINHTALFFELDYSILVHILKLFLSLVLILLKHKWVRHVKLSSNAKLRDLREL